jgi:hypothetical protein
MSFARGHCELNALQQIQHPTFVPFKGDYRHAFVCLLGLII